MQTKYDTNQYVLVKAKVKSILLEEDNKPHYIVKVKCDDYRMCGDMNAWIEEDQIVCGWIGEKDG